MGWFGGKGPKSPPSPEEPTAGDTEGRGRAAKGPSRPRLVFNEKPKPRPTPENDPSIRKLSTNSGGVFTETYRADTVYPGFERMLVRKTLRVREETAAGVVEANKATLAEYDALAKAQRAGLGQLMGGETPGNSLLEGNSFHLPVERVKPHYLLQYPDGKYATSVGRVFSTGRDLQWLSANFPDDHFKFYQSFDVRTPEKQAAAQAYMSELIEACVKRNITLRTKSFDHDYDSCNLYTHDRETMQELLAELYPKYQPQGIFLEAQRYFQAPIAGINPKHIAWVQESFRTESSHSTRMHKLGLAIEAGKTFEQACAEVGVKPEAPWLEAI